MTVGYAESDYNIFKWPHSLVWTETPWRAEVQNIFSVILNNFVLDQSVYMYWNTNICSIFAVCICLLALCGFCTNTGCRSLDTQPLACTWVTDFHHLSCQNDTQNDTRVTFPFIFIYQSVFGHWCCCLLRNFLWATTISSTIAHQLFVMQAITIPMTCRIQHACKRVEKPAHAYA